MRTLTPAVVADKNKLAQAQPWVFLVELDLDGVNAFRVAANYDDTITYQGVPWYPARLEVGVTKRSADGRIDDATLKISHVSRRLINYLDGVQILSRGVRLIVLDVAEAADPDAGVEDVYSAQALEVLDSELVCRIGVANPLQLPVPAERFGRSLCRYLHEYGDPAKRCRYDSSLAGALLSCDGTFDGANGCVVHGLDELARGLLPEHPRQYGGQPGIPKGSFDV